MVRFIPFFVLSEHCVQDSQQLAYTGNQRHFFGFSCGKQSHVKHLYYRVKAGCDKRCHVQGCSHTSPAAKDGSVALSSCPSPGLLEPYRQAH